MEAVVEQGEVEVRHFLLATQAFFFLCVGVCLFMDHSAKAESGGISFYGVYHRTLLIIILGFGVGSYGLWRASTYLARAGLAHLSVLGLRCLAVGLVLLLLTPYNKGAFFNWAHMSVGIVMALVELAIVSQLTRLHRSWQALGALTVQLVGGVWAGARLAFFVSVGGRADLRGGIRLVPDRMDLRPFFSTFAFDTGLSVESRDDVLRLHRHQREPRGGLRNYRGPSGHGPALAREHRRTVAGDGDGTSHRGQVQGHQQSRPREVVDQRTNHPV
jgi:hypothetical protein